MFGKNLDCHIAAQADIAAATALPGILGRAARAFGRFVDVLSKSWREEMSLIERNRAPQRRIILVECRVGSVRG